MAPIYKEELLNGTNFTEWHQFHAPLGETIWGHYNGQYYRELNDQYISTRPE